MGREMASNLLSKTLQASNDPEMTFVVHDSFDQVCFFRLSSCFTENLQVHHKISYLQHESVPWAGHSARILSCRVCFMGYSLALLIRCDSVASLASTIITMVPSSPRMYILFRKWKLIPFSNRGQGGVSGGKWHLRGPSIFGKTIGPLQQYAVY